MAVRVSVGGRPVDRCCTALGIRPDGSRALAVRRLVVTSIGGGHEARILSSILMASLTSAAPAQRNEQNRPPIIDVHVHAYEKDARWDIKAPNPRTGRPPEGP